MKIYLDEFGDVIEDPAAALAAVRGLAAVDIYKKRDNPPDLLDLM